MKEYDDILKRATDALMEYIPQGPSDQLKETTTAKLNQLDREVSAEKSAKPTGIFERIRHMKTITKLSAAAVVIIATLISVAVMDKFVSTAYAIEQTIKACHSVRFIHMRQIKPEFEDQPILVWAEFFEDGQPKKIRMHMPEWVNGKASDDGAKEVVWENNAATVWLKKKNVLLRVPDQKVADDILRIVKEQDPKLFVQFLLDKQSRGEAEIQIEQPHDKTMPILITSIKLPDKKSKLLLYIDQATQLPFKGETYTLKDGEYVLTNIGEYHDYNQPIDPAMFTFDNLPEDVMRIDQITQQVGLEQGDMTNDEVAVEVVRRFWQAVIENDFDKAGQFLEGTPGPALKKMFEERLRARFLEIVSVGPVKPHPNPETKGVIVPCTLKIERDGRITELKRERIGVRQVYNQPGRWTIFGGL